ncbi:MAG: UDP-N-acetylglucosamine 2-epimerase (non-hydrolyzing) [Methanobacteriaceae archaeon]
MKIVTVLGARPQFIKAALVSHELRKNNEEVIIHTGQHYNIELSEIFFKEMGIPQPDYNLEVGSGTHATQTARMMMKLEKKFQQLQPDMVLLYGDTNSTLAAAVTASKLNLPIAHVEAGPRMYDKSVPEEVNRIITDHISTLLFAPTPLAAENLYKEGLKDPVHITGDVMYDLFLYFSKRADKSSNILGELGLNSGEYLLTTIHRARNTDSIENLKAITCAFQILSSHCKIVFPAHPRTVKYLKKYGLYDALDENPNIQQIKPVGYLDMNILTRNASKIITDSGGLQKEAFFAQVPCITLDSSTGWPETVLEGWNTIFTETKYKFFDEEEIVDVVSNFNPKGEYENVFGEGDASKNICKIIEDYGENNHP